MAEISKVPTYELRLVVRAVLRLLLSVIIGFIIAALIAGKIGADMGSYIEFGSTLATVLIVLCTIIIWFFLSSVGPLKNRA
jgi:hypothetical protein